ncbi:unnamed protein product, partial [marine sediment metagenome]
NKDTLYFLFSIKSRNIKEDCFSLPIVNLKEIRGENDT